MSIILHSPKMPWSQRQQLLSPIPSNYYKPYSPPGMRFVISGLGGGIWTTWMPSDGCGLAFPFLGVSVSQIIIRTIFRHRLNWVARTVSCTSQLFYAWRIYILGKQPLLTGIVALVGSYILMICRSNHVSQLACVQCGFGIYSGVYSHILGRFSEGGISLLHSLIIFPTGYSASPHVPNHYCKPYDSIVDHFVWFHDLRFGLVDQLFVT